MGPPYLFISVAVESYSPAAVVAGRTLLGAVILLPFAIRQKALRPAVAKIGWVLLFGAIEMAGPFLLLGHAEQTLPSGLTGLLVATVPLFAAIIAFGGGDRSVLSPARSIGLFVGFVGVFVMVAGPGLAVESGNGLIAVGEVLLVAAVRDRAVRHRDQAARRAPTRLHHPRPPRGRDLYTPIAFLTQHQVPTLEGTLALIALAVLCTALAFITFFALIARVGPVRAPLFTYVNPVVAIVLGTLILGEALTVGLLIGFPLMMAGCWLAATGVTVRSRKITADLPPIARS